MTVINTAANPMCASNPFVCTDPTAPTTGEVLDSLCQPPEVCANAEDNKREHLLKHTTDSQANFFDKSLQRDKDLFFAIIAMVMLMHIPYLKFTTYPFMIFSTWVHEMCHGMAAILVGGSISKLYVYKDGSGLAYTRTSGEDWKRVVVASAGYTGTAVIGAIFLVFRRTRRGPTVGLIGMGCAMILSVILYVRNAFGIGIVSVMGLAIIICGWRLSAQWVLYLYCFLAATCSFNALDSIQDLLEMQEGEAYVNGQQSSTDAHSVAEIMGITPGAWAFIWLVFATIMLALGFFYPVDGNTTRKNKKELKKAQTNSSLPQYNNQQSQQQQGQPQQPLSNSLVPMNPDYHQQQDVPVVQATLY